LVCWLSGSHHDSGTPACKNGRRRYYKDIVLRK
jgi:hypothetical protein